MGRLDTAVLPPDWKRRDRQHGAGAGEPGAAGDGADQPTGASADAAVSADVAKRRKTLGEAGARMELEVVADSLGAAVIVHPDKRDERPRPRPLALSTPPMGYGSRMLLCWRGRSFRSLRLGRSRSCRSRPSAVTSRRWRTMGAGDVEAGRDEPFLHPGGRGAVRGFQSPLGRRPAGDDGHGRRPAKTPAAASTWSNRAARSRRRSSRRPPVSGIGCATSCSARRSTSRACSA